MSIEKKYRCLGFEAPIMVGESVDEVNRLGKSANTCLDGFNNDYVYRGPLAEVRSSLCAFLEENTGIKRNTKEVTNKDGSKKTLPDEKESAYVARVQASLGLGDEEFITKFQSEIDKIARAIAFDPSATERKAPEPKQVSAAFKSQAEAIYANADTTVPKQMFALLAKERDWPMPADADMNVVLMGEWLQRYARTQNLASALLAKL